MPQPLSSVPVSVELPSTISTVEDLVQVVVNDERLADFRVKEQGQHHAEFTIPHGSLICVWPEVWRDAARLSPHLTRALAGYSPILLFGSDDQFDGEQINSLREAADVALELTPVGHERLVARLCNFADSCRVRRAAEEGEVLRGQYRYELDELNAIGRALSSERNIDTLLDLILEKTRDVTGADAGSVYVIEGGDEDVLKRTVRFKVSQNDSVQLDFTEFTLPVSPKSIVGHAVITRELVNIPDLYSLAEPGTRENPFGFQHNRAFDDKIGYQTRSMLTVPMIDAHEQVIGVIQLINKKQQIDAVLVSPEHFEEQVVPFDARSEEIASTLASQAGIALENAQLYLEIQNLFESFVRASVSAIESRDPTTSGHSQRVADLTVALAEATQKADQGEYKDFTIDTSELKTVEYAALLHDFGKVGVRENVLVKANKLYEHERDLILARFDFIRKSLEADSAQTKLRYFMEMSRDEALSKLGEVDAEHQARVQEIDDFLEFVLKTNQPTVMDQGGFERLADIAGRRYFDMSGEDRPYLTDPEMTALQVMRGSLTESERREIENHVTHTFNFLKMIPWGRRFKGVAEIAGAHHEKLDGSGYPRRLKKDDIPVPARMMTIADIYDALTASDRPYKKAMPMERALDIIGYEVKAGKCDPELYRIFIDAQIFKVTNTGA